MKIIYIVPNPRMGYDNIKAIDWKLDDGCPNEEIIDMIKYLVIETVEEHSRIHTLFDNLPKCKHMHAEDIRYYGDMAKFILSNL